jgi:hypothetical protein
MMNLRIEYHSAAMPGPVTSTGTTNLSGGKQKLTKMCE